MSKLKLHTTKIAESETEWTQSDNHKNLYFRIWEGYLFKKEVNKAYFGGFKILKAKLNSAIATEWEEENFNHVYKVPSKK